MSRSSFEQGCLRKTSDSFALLHQNELMASTFSPITLSDDPRSWKAEIGLLNPDQTAVSFDSLNDLIRWLKTLSVDVDSNLTRSVAQLFRLPES